MGRKIASILIVIAVAIGAYVLHQRRQAESAVSDAPDTPPAPFDQLRGDWAADLEAHRLEPSLARYSADATFINPDGTHSDGAPEIRKLYKMVFAAYDGHVEFTPRTTEQSDELAYDSGTYTEDLTDRASHETQHISGDYLTIYRYEKDGKWRIAQQAWTEAPAKK